MVIKPTRNIFLFKGSVLGDVWLILLANGLFAMLVTYVYVSIANDNPYTITHIPFLLIGGGLGIYLAFRNNSCYTRYWEGRKLWGALFVNCTTLHRQLKLFVKISSEVEKPMRIKDVEHLEHQLVYLLISFSHSCRLVLRDQPLLPEISEWLPKDVSQELIHTNPNNFPFFLINEMSRCLRLLSIKGWITNYELVEMQAGLKEITFIYAGCLRIKTTPVPFPYTQMVKVSTWLYCFLLPFGIATTIGVLTPMVSVFIAYLFFGLDAVSDQLEQPFGTDSNDLPLNFFAKNIEIELLRSLGEQDLPKMPAPVNHILL